MSHLSTQDIDRLAELARLSLEKEEKEKLRSELGLILGYVDRLQKVDTAGVLEGSMLPRLDLRADESLATNASVRERILVNFPDRMGDALRVPAVFEKPKG
ncbi:Asp-tRNA(Asn)/Glu-tRNA(Gln) amidotransferase subunit GatC [Candidatus Uhrbacteria bacterium]|nr:Asp-tRNA(Asn)/Glu-tRNA(Gln) amidotransferase subunit GatC [Candidatus Uhrbacteria bacterium]